MKKLDKVWIPITVRFASNNDLLRSQEALRTRLRNVLNEMKHDGHIEKARIQTVFPNDRDPNLSTIFVANIQGNPEAAVRLLGETSDIEYAAVAPPRRAI